MPAMPTPGPARVLRRRGVAALSAVIMLASLALVAGAVVSGGANDQMLVSAQIDATRATFAADAGVEMVTKELMDNADHDGDGGIGSLSADGNDANNPLIGGCRVGATRRVNGNLITVVVTAVGRESARRVELTFQQ